MAERTRLAHEAERRDDVQQAARRVRPAERAPALPPALRSRVARAAHARVYETWPGRNRFALGGRCVSSREWLGPCCLAAALALPLVLLAVVPSLGLSRALTGFAVVGTALLQVLAFALLLLVRGVDPGILPRYALAARLGLTDLAPAEGGEGGDASCDSDGAPVLRSGARGRRVCRT